MDATITALRTQLETLDQQAAAPPPHPAAPGQLRRRLLGSMEAFFTQLAEEHRWS